MERLLIAAIVLAFAGLYAAAAAEPEATAGPAKRPLPTKNAAGRAVNPEVWLCHSRAYELGRSEADWAFVKKHITGIKLYTGMVRKANGPRLARLEQFVRMCKANGIQLSIECGGTLGFASLDDNNGVKSAEIEQRSSKKVFDLGGRVDYLDMDGPVRRLLYPETRRPDGTIVHREGFKSVDRCADQLVIYMRSMRAVHPSIKFFLLTNFPNWGYRDYPSYHARGPARQDWGDYDAVVRTVVAKTKAARLPLAGVTVDNPYDYFIGEHSSVKQDPGKVDWVKRVLELERFCRSNGVEFNLIVNSERGGKKSAEAFCEETLKMVDVYRKAGGRPTRYMVQTWYRNPKAVEPESQPHTMTALVKAVLLKVHSELAGDPLAEDPPAGGEAPAPADGQGAAPDPAGDSEAGQAGN